MASDDSDSGDSGGGGGGFGAIGGAIGGAVDAVDEATDPIQDTVGEVGGAVGDAAGDAGETVDEGADDTGGSVGGSTGEAIADAPDRVSQGVSDTADRVSSGVDTARETVSAGRDVVTGTAARGREVVGQTDSAPDAPVRQTIGQVGSAVGSAAGDFGQTVQQGVNDLPIDQRQPARRGQRRRRPEPRQTIELDGIEYYQNEDGTLGERVESPSDVDLEEGDQLEGDAIAGADAEQRGQTTASDVTTEGLPQTGMQEVFGGYSTEVTDDLTRGGVLSETPDDTSGLLPGEVAGVDISEERVRGAAEWGDKQKAEFDEGGDIFGSPRAESALQGAAGVGVDILNVPQHIQTAETAVEVGQSTPGAVDEYGAATVGSTFAGVGAAAGGSMLRDAKSDPIEFGSGAVFGYVTGAAAGRAAGKVGRGVRDRVRTAGGSKVDAGDLAGEDVLRYTDTDGAEGTQFPGARDPDTYRSDPATAVREQADEFTPDEVSDFFEQQGVEEGTVMKKALDTEPEGPGRGRSDTGFTSAPDEVDGEFDYETPGSFFGPELSPNFLRVGGGEASFSPVPGLPDFGNKPTGVLARTDVEAPDADTLDEFNREMMDNVGDTTARTKPAGEGSVGEAEAVVPPGAEFESVGSGGLRGVGRRFGIGSDFYTEVDGRRVPLRTVAPSDRTPDADVPTPTVVAGCSATVAARVASHSITTSRVPSNPSTGRCPSASVAAAVARPARRSRPRSPIPGQPTTTTPLASTIAHGRQASPTRRGADRASPASPTAPPVAGRSRARPPAPSAARAAVGRRPRGRTDRRRPRAPRRRNHPRVGRRRAGRRVTAAGAARRRRVCPHRAGCRGNHRGARRVTRPRDGPETTVRSKTTSWSGPNPSPARRPRRSTRTRSRAGRTCCSVASAQKATAATARTAATTRCFSKPAA